MEQWISEPLTLTFTHREKEYVAATRLFYGRVYHTRLIIVISIIGLSLGLVLILMDIDYIMGGMAAVLGFTLFGP